MPRRQTRRSKKMRGGAGLLFLKWSGTDADPNGYFVELEDRDYDGVDTVEDSLRERLEAHVASAGYTNVHVVPDLTAVEVTFDPASNPGAPGDFTFTGEVRKGRKTKKLTFTAKFDQDVGPDSPGSSSDSDTDGGRRRGKKQRRTRRRHSRR